MSAEENKALIRRLTEEAWNQNLKVIDDIVANDFVGHDPTIPDDIRGPRGARDVFSMYLKVFPDLRFTIDDMVAEGDRVVLRWTARGTQRGEFQGIAPTGKRCAVTGVEIDRIADGKIAEVWVYYDTLGMLRQLGAFPESLAA